MAKRILILALFVAGISFIAVSKEVTKLSWEDLRPASEIKQNLAINPHENLTEEQLLNDDLFADDPLSWEQDIRPIVPELDGKNIELGGFMVPLDGDEERITEFLLVPYPGACIHVPPPPTNQILHVTYNKGISIDAFENLITDAISITGTIHTVQFNEEYFSAGYSFTATSAKLYE